MKLSKLKELVQKLENDSNGTDPEVFFYSIHSQDSVFDVLEQTERLTAKEMCFGGEYHLPIE